VATRLLTLKLKIIFAWPFPWVAFIELRAPFRMKILVADDEPIARTMLEHWVTGWGYEVVSAKDGQAALTALDTDASIRIAVVDWVMPHLDGLEVCREVRRNHEVPYVYFILLSARDDKNDLNRAFDCGADDYLVKPCNSFELRIRLRAAARVIALEDQVAEAQKALQVQAMNDPTSGALNRTPLLELLKRELARSERRSESVSMVLANIDQFDEFGAGRSDGFKREIADEAVARFRGVVRKYDLLGQLAPGQFALVLPQCEVERSVEVAARLQYALSSTPFSIGSETLRVTASYGMAATGQSPGARMEELLRATSQALKLARRDGRNRLRVAGAQDWLDSEKAGTAAPSVPAA
jgi:diguanylate cyclase (GGDEF)-like protein